MAIQLGQLSRQQFNVSCQELSRISMLVEPESRWRIRTVAVSVVVEEDEGEREAEWEELNDVDRENKTYTDR